MIQSYKNFDYFTKAIATMPRPTKLTKDIQKQICDTLKNGATRRDAVLTSGIVYQTFLTWLEKGRKQKYGIYVEFLESVEQAEAEARLKFTKVIMDAAEDGNWKAAMGYLRVRDPDNWGENPNQGNTETITVEVVYKNNKNDANNTN